MTGEIKTTDNGQGQWQVQDGSGKDLYDGTGTILGEYTKATTKADGVTTTTADGVTTVSVVSGGQELDISVNPGTADKPVLTAPAKGADLSGLSQISWFSGSSFVAFLLAFFSAMEMFMQLQSTEQKFEFQGMMNTLTLGADQATAIGVSMDADISKEWMQMGTSIGQAATNFASAGAMVGASALAKSATKDQTKGLEDDIEDQKNEITRLKNQESIAAVGPPKVPPPPKTWTELSQKEKNDYAGGDISANPAEDASAGKSYQANVYSVNKSRYDSAVRAKAKYDTDLSNGAGGVKTSSQIEDEIKQCNNKISSNSQQIKKIQNDWITHNDQLISMFTQGISKTLDAVTAGMSATFDGIKKGAEMAKAMIAADQDVNKQSTDSAHQAFQSSIQEFDSMIQLLRQLSEWVAKWGGRGQ